MKCSTCGREIDGDSKFCVYCGAKTDGPNSAQTMGGPTPNERLVDANQGEANTGSGERRSIGRKRLPLIVGGIVLVGALVGLGCFSAALYRQNQMLQSVVHTGTSVSTPVEPSGTSSTASAGSGSGTASNGSSAGTVSQASQGSSESSASSTKDDSQDAGNNDLIFIAKGTKCIFIDGKAIDNHETRLMTVPMDSSGDMGKFFIELDQGARITIGTDKVGQDITDDFGEYADDLTKLFEDPVTTRDYYIQVTPYDFDHDGTKELAVSVGDKGAVMQTLLYRFTNSTDMPFVLVGRIDGEAKMYVEADGDIDVPIGSQGIVYPYKYAEKKLYEVDYDAKGNSTLKEVPLEK